MTRELLQLLQYHLRGELRRARRRKRSTPLLIAVLIMAIFAISQFLEEPKAPPPAKDAELSCALREVYDGDTVAVRCDSGTLTVRVWGIDAPERGQKPWGERSRGHLSNLLPGDTVRLQVADIDRYGRTVARIYQGDQDIGLALVRQGGAVIYPQYNQSPVHTPAYQAAQRQARQERLGVWSRPGAHQEPWEWRKVNPRS